MSAQVVVLDANVLFGALCRDFLLRLAERGAYTPVWSAKILDEFINSLVEFRPDLERARLDRTRRRMEIHFPAALVAPALGDYSSVPESIDEGDRHVVAVAMAASAHIIVTQNTCHFPAYALSANGVSVLSIDTFLLSLLTGHRDAIAATLLEMSHDYTRPTMSVDDLLAALSPHAREFVARFKA